MLVCMRLLDLIFRKKNLEMITKLLLLQADIDSLKVAIGSALDVMHAMASSIFSFLPRVRYEIFPSYT